MTALCLAKDSQQKHSGVYSRPASPNDITLFKDVTLFMRAITQYCRMTYDTGLS